MLNITEIEYKSYGRCIKIDNGVISLLATVDLGPRIISFSLCGKENVLKEDVENTVMRDDKILHDFFETDENWYIYGGHRLWSSPESYPGSYTPDNSPVSYMVEDNKLTLMPPQKRKVGEEHILKIIMDEQLPEVTVNHKIANISDKALTLAPWCLTVADKGGTEVFPVSKKQTGLLSNRRLVVWEYTDINDSRFYMDNDYITLKQTDCDKAFKIGINNEEGWSAYLNKGQVFIKRFGFSDTSIYPDYGVNFETYTNASIMEIESLGKLETLQPGEMAEHTEKWEIKPCSETFDCRSNAAISAFAEKYVR